MKLLISISALLISLNSSACERPYLMKVGAFFNSASVVTFWSDFATELSKKVECPVNLIPSPTYKSHLKDLINQDGDIFIVGGYHSHTFESLGLTPVLKVSSPSNTYLVTQKQFDPNNLKTLVGKTIDIVSKYSPAYVITKIKLKEAGVLDQVNFKVGSSYQTNAMNLIKGKTEAAAIIAPIYDALPDVIKDNVNIVTLHTNPASAYIMAHPNTPPELIKGIQSSHHKINLFKWILTNKATLRDDYNDMFKQQLLDLIEEIKPPKNKPLAR
jgi:ABC-type phosphate/phosphonate transport system substrate-binding protein